MKKIYSLIALGCAMFLPTQSHALNSISQLTGTASLICYDIEDKDSKNYSVNIVEGSNPNEILIQNLYYLQGSEIPATVDLEAGTVTFKSLVDYTFVESYEGYANFQLNLYNSYHTRFNPVDEVTATIAADGTGAILFPDNVVIQIIVPEGIKPDPMNPDAGGEPGTHTLCTLTSEDGVDMYFQPAKRDWTYIPEEWEPAGKATYQDGWFAPFFGYNLNGDKELVYTVDYYTNKQNPAKILIKNPYANSIFKDASVTGTDYVNTGSGEGFIFIDTTDPDFVTVWWKVPAGYSCAALGDNIQCYNEEGYQLCDEGYTISTIKYIMNMYGYYNYSNRKGDVIRILNLEVSSSKYNNAYAGSGPMPYAEAATVITLNATAGGGDNPDPEPTVNAIPDGAELFPYNYKYYSNVQQQTLEGNMQIAAEEGLIYFKNLIPSLPGAVIIGEIDQTTGIVTIPQGQCIAETADGPVYINYLLWDGLNGAWIYPTAEEGGYQLQMNEDEEFVSFKDPYSFEYPYLGIRTADAYIDYINDIELKEGSIVIDNPWDATGKTELTMPAGVEILPYQLSASFEQNLGRESILVDVAFDGNYIYVKGLSYHMPDAVVRMNYDPTTRKVTIPQGQLVGYYEGEPYFTRTYGLNFNTFGIEPLPFDTEYTLNLTEDGIFMVPQGDMQYWYLGFYNPNVRSESTFAYGCLELIAGIRLVPYVDRSGTPANAYGLDYDETFGDFTFMLPNYTTDNVEMNTSGLYYEIYVNGEKLYFQGPEGGAEGPYMGTYGTDMLWYGFNNDVDIIAKGLVHTILIYEKPVETLGVRSVYVYSDILNPQTTTYSEIVTLDVASGEITAGLNSISSGDVISTEYYTIDGKKINNPDKGVYIIRSTLSNGNIVVKKVVNK